MATNKGFDAPRSDTFMFDPDEIVIVGLDTSDGPEHALWDKRIQLPVDEGTVASIVGTAARPGMVYEPILVTKYEGKDEKFAGKPAVIDGRQRVRAAREAKKQMKARGDKLPLRVESKVRRGDDLTLGLISLTTNEIRRDDDMLVKAEKALYYRERGASIEDLAIAFGVTQKAIEQWLPLAEAPSKVKHAIAAGQISPTAAAKIAKLDTKEEQEQALAEAVATGKTSAQAIRKAIAQKTSKSNGKAEVDEDQVGLPAKKDQRALFSFVEGSAEFDDTKEGNYWAGFHDALALVLGARPAQRGRANEAKRHMEKVRAGKVKKGAEA